MAKTEIFDRTLSANGYRPEDYQVDLLIYSESNQVIIVQDITRKRELFVPVEDDVLQWPFTRLGEAVVAALDDANRQTPDNSPYPF